MLIERSEMSIGTRGDPNYTRDENTIRNPPEEGLLNQTMVLVAPDVSSVDRSTLLSSASPPEPVSDYSRVTCARRETHSRGWLVVPMTASCSRTQTGRNALGNLAASEGAFAPLARSDIYCAHIIESFLHVELTKSGEYTRLSWLDWRKSNMRYVCRRESQIGRSESYPWATWVST